MSEQTTGPWDDSRGLRYHKTDLGPVESFQAWAGLWLAFPLGDRWAVPQEDGRLSSPGAMGATREQALAELAEVLARHRALMPNL